MIDPFLKLIYGICDSGPTTSPVRPPENSKDTIYTSLSRDGQEVSPRIAVSFDFESGGSIVFGVEFPIELVNGVSLFFDASDVAPFIIIGMKSVKLFAGDVISVRYTLHTDAIREDQRNLKTLKEAHLLGVLEWA